MSTQLSRHFIFDRASSRAVDQATVERFGMPGIILMENAARGAADVALDMLDEAGGKTRTVIVVCGGGNNGGDGYALARHLHNAGAGVKIVDLSDPKSGTDAAVNREICRRMQIPMNPLKESRLDQAALIVDAIFGTGLDRPVEGDGADAIMSINASDRPILAIDIPSGLDCDSGEALGVAVRAMRTASFLGVKQGFLNEASREYVGRIEVVQIGAPRELLAEFGRLSATDHQGG